VPRLKNVWSYTSTPQYAFMKRFAERRSGVTPHEKELHISASVHHVKSVKVRERALFEPNMKEMNKHNYNP
jgi:hypothetical protein